MSKVTTARVGSGGCRANTQPVRRGVSMADSTRSVPSGKASKRKPFLFKPHKDFPLSPRADGRWAKKVKGKVHIFSGTADEALTVWLKEKDFILLHGRRPPAGSEDGFTVEDL